jgi:hypothetical protein
MQEYFNRVKIKNLARECFNQAEKTGVVLVEEVSFLFSFILHELVK